MRGSWKVAKLSAILNVRNAANPTIGSLVRQLPYDGHARVRSLALKKRLPVYGKWHAKPHTIIKKIKKREGKAPS